VLSKIRVTPLAAESFGARSMCTFVETPETRVLLDAGVSLVPNRSGLPPHPIEFRTIAKLRKKIAAAAESAEIVTISHYHFDHHTPSYEDWLVNWTEPGETARQIYQDKTVFLKNPRNRINSSQRHRGWLFQKTGGKHARKLQSADGNVFELGKETLLRFSEPVPHGPDDASLGWVIMTEVEFDDERFMFAPDVQGPMFSRTLELIENAGPQILMVGGPPFYLSNRKVDPMQLEKAVTNLQRIVKFVPLTILEHHILRDPLWRERAKPVLDAATKFGHRVLTAAEFVGQENSFLESKRRELYAKDPPSKEFEHWMKIGWRKEGSPKPPL
jgi:hypothetical protein